MRTYSSFLHHCARSGDADGADSWFELMKVYEIEANNAAYNSVLAAHVRAQTSASQFSAAVQKYLQEMKDKNVAITNDLQHKMY